MSRPRPTVAGSTVIVEVTLGPSKPVERASNYRADRHPEESHLQGESFWVRLTEDPIAFFTFALFLATAALGGVAIIQIIYLRRADETTRIAANAAAKSAEIAASSVSPLIAIVIAEPFIERDAYRPIGAVTPATSYRTNPKISYYFRNYGRTPAIMKDVKAEFELAGEPPTLRNDAISLTFVPNRIIAESQDTARVDTQPMTLTDEIKKSLEMGFIYLWLHGTAEFDDMFGNEFVHEFCWRWDGPQSVFGPYDEDRKRNRTYAKKESG